MNIQMKDIVNQHVSVISVDKMNYIDQTWDYWEPKTNLEKILKIHISKIV